MRSRWAQAPSVRGPGTRNPYTGALWSAGVEPLGTPEKRTRYRLCSRDERNGTGRGSPRGPRARRASTPPVPVLTGSSAVSCGSTDHQTGRGLSEPPRAPSRPYPRSPSPCPCPVHPVEGDTVSVGGGRGGVPVRGCPPVVEGEGYPCVCWPSRPCWWGGVRGVSTAGGCRGGWSCPGSRGGCVHHPYPIPPFRIHSHP